ncbi:hypothetical protein RBH29_17300 [Herbivorax sp. ANBcel31]|uniref:hypothetical protein n=1 Tax=Herbivorax sp. ANBcel31 TaxID=3069754 RepID=UPI0027B10D2A|nr:hypothetical protein [Herbivorax sp. ANBcel31]MDQ2088182.1 hypothetical protein [Herbivorax sp. ANBcel31]
MREAFYSLDNENIAKLPELTLYYFYEELIYFFSRESALEIVKKYEKATDDYYNYFYHDIINMTKNELSTKIEKSDSELVLPFITVWLWKQRLGEIPMDQKIQLDKNLISGLVDDFGDYIVRNIYKMMTLTGYDNI